MLPKSAKAKGKRLEKWVCSRLKTIDPHCYSRADSGSGKFHKEDITTSLPLHIEIKNQATLELLTWWKQTLESCPASKYPVLIYRLNFQKMPTVYMRFSDLLSYISGNKIETFHFNISLSFNDFLQVVKEVTIKNGKK